MRWHRSVWVGLGLAAWCLGASSSETLAQFPIASGPPMIATAPVITSSAPIVSSPGVTYSTPSFSQTRRSARTANRYTVSRPVYAGRPGVTFAPYSDYYFPRVIGARETVYTAAPDAPVPTGYRAFARPYGYPVYPR